MENKTKYDKILTKSFSLLSKLTKSKWTDTSYLDGEKIEIIKQQKGYKLSDSNINRKKNFKNTEITTQFGQLEILDIGSCSSYRSFGKDKVVFENTYSINSFKLKNFSQTSNSYFRLVIPINKEPNFFTSIEESLISILYKTRKHNTKNSIKIPIGVNNYDLYEFKPNDQTLFLIIDSHQEHSCELFSETCFSILLSFGFITGTFYQGDKFYFEYENSELKSPISFKFDSFRETISSVTHPISSNPYVPAIPEEHRLKLGEIKKITHLNFSKLCELCFKNIDFRIIILQVIESTKASLITSAFMMAVCIEELSSLILKKEDIARTLNDDEKRFVNLLNSFFKQKDLINNSNNELANQIKCDVSFRAKKNSNKEQLIKVFNKLEIPLNKREQEAIENRNKLLHGECPEIKGIKINNQDDIDKAYLYLYPSLYTLVCAAILKYIGYNDKIYNQCKFYEESTGYFITDEKYYKELKIEKTI